ncbi:MAG: ATP-binding protein [bacterium]
MAQTLTDPNHKLLQQILSSLPLAVFIMDLDRRIIYFNLMAEQITGYSSREMLGNPCCRLEFKDCQTPCSFLAPTGRHNPSLKQSSFRHKDGQQIPVLRGIYPLKNEHGKVIGTMETLLDINWSQGHSGCPPACLSNLSLEISREVHLRKLIERSKNKLLGIFDEIIDGLFMIDHEYRIKAMNKTQAFYLDKTPKELIENYCYQAIANRTSPCPICKVAQVFQEGITKTDLNILFNEDIRCTQGSRDSRRYVNIHYIPIKNELGQVHNALIYIQDISKIKELEEGVRRTEHLASLGILASGVAHEINNPLQVILSGSNCLIRKVDDRETILELALEIKECAEKMASIIKDLSLYSRGIREEKAVTLIQVDQILNSSISMASHARNMGKIVIEKEYRPIAPILGNPSRFQQIFVNLILNAVDAMDGTGTLLLKTFQQNGFICIQVTDTGCGIREEDLPYIFDPFFTTKAPGKGTGLGLNVVYRLVSQYQGKIHVETKKKQGTRFTLEFPIAQSNDEYEVKNQNVKAPDPADR